MGRNDAAANPQKTAHNVYIVTHVYKGIINTIRAFSAESDADKYKEGLCKENGLPIDDQERHMQESDSDIQEWIVELQ